jgi:chitinase
MSTRVSVWLPNRALTFFLASLLVSFFFARPTLANEPNHDHKSKVVGGYFEEWSIYGAGYNVANLQANGVADKLTHLTYAFGDATPPAVP